MSRLPLPSDRSRVAWWLLTGALAALLLFAVFSLIGTVVLGLFVYYGLRPVCRRLRSIVGSRGEAAALTLLAVALPVAVLLAYVGVAGLRELGPLLRTYGSVLEPYLNVSSLKSHPLRTLSRFLRNPGTPSLSQVLSAWGTFVGPVLTGVTHLFVAVTLAFFLLRDDVRIARWFRSEIGDAGTTAYAYATAVDRDLETIYFSNVLLVFLVAGLSLVTYHAYNLVAPASLVVPFPTVLALLTGVASLIPIVVGKVVYVPLTAYLGWKAARIDPSLVIYPAALFAVALLALDLIPLTFLLPKLAARKTHVGLVMFAYVVGTILFGWYGLFLGPLLVVLGIQVVRVVFSELIHGEPVTPTVRAAGAMGSEPKGDAGESD
ncbi:AI-2E family transporter [Halomarina pelagica]|uniref:AI-2E family transporter n=1 Tax=Halomarina pelagica TaxID=2961599 RepID=UPI0020C3E612|nr:AI-2E family transporter [Halomarina sp. BND7]